MCSSRQLIESSHETSSSSNDPPVTMTTPPTTPVLPDDTRPEWTNQKSPSDLLTIKTEQPSSYSTEDAVNNNLPSSLGNDNKLDTLSCLNKDKKGHKRSKKRGRGEKKKKKGSRRNSDGDESAKVDMTRNKAEVGESNRVTGGEGFVEEKKLEIEASSSSKLEIKVEKCESNAECDVEIGNTDTSATYVDKCEDAEETQSLGGESSGQRRKSSRSCKGRLYRQMVMGGMLESLQRPERPFNCKKPWRHSGESAGNYSDGEEVFEPEPEKTKRPARRRSRKRTLSGGVALPVDL